MFQKSDYFIILAVAISFVISAYLWFVIGDREQAIFTAIWIPSIFTFGIYFKLCALSLDLIFPAIVVFALMLTGVVLTVIEFKRMERDEAERDRERGNSRRE